VLLEGVTLPAEVALYQGAGNRYWLNKIYYEADVLISLPVLKNHLVSGITGAVKNIGIGATPPTIYGFGPGSSVPYERWGTIDHELSWSLRLNLHYWIHDYYMCRPVDFVIMDGLQGIENGPLCHEFLNGSQHISEDQMNARLICAGRDPIALDTIASLLCGHDPALVPHLITLHNDEQGCSDPRLIYTNGARVGDESQGYEINDSGSYSRHYDFEAPSFAIDSCFVVGNDLHLQLTVDADVTRVDATVDGEFVGQIRLGEFEDFVFDLSLLPGDDVLEVTVYAYDQYLNHSSQTVYVQPVTGIPDAGRRVAPLMRVGPTPVMATTTIDYELVRSGRIRLAIYDVNGREVTRLVDAERSAGPHRVSWDARGVAAGVYFARLETAGGVISEKLAKIE
jgi:hypothetical protein